MRRISTFIGGLIFWTMAVHAADLEVKAFVDKTVVAQNQEFTLSVEISGKDAQAAPNPQMPKMDDFAVFLGSGSSQSIQFVNGSMSASKTISYHYMAATPGTFTIGPVVVAHKGGDIQTDPIQITIQQDNASPSPRAKSSQPAARGGQSTPSDAGGQDLHIRARVNKTSVYPNEPVIVTYQIYTRVNLTPVGISKQPGTAGFWAEDFDLPQQLPTTTEVINGQRYTVATFKKTALFPTSPGKKTIEPLGFDCDVRVQRSRSRDPFDDFFNDSFFLGRTERKTLYANPLTIDVKPFPEDGKPSDFTGATGSFRIDASVDKTNTETNDAVTFKVTLSGTGNIRTMQELDVHIPPDFEAYPPKISESVNRTGSAISGNKTFEYVLVPRNPGLQKISPIRFSYFDPETRSYKTIRSPEFAIQVAKGKDTFVSTSGGGTARTAVQYLGKDIRFIRTQIPQFHRIGSSFYNAGFFWLAVLFPLAALGLAFVYQRHLTRLEGDVAYARGRQAGRAARKHLARARALLKPDGADAFYTEVARALSSFVGNKLNIAEAGMIGEDVRKRLKEKGVGDPTSDAYFECLGICDRMRFSPSGSGEDEMKTFLGKAEKAITDLDRQIKG